MSATFSFSRIGKLVTKQLFENLRLYVFSALALFGLLALIFAFWFMTSGSSFEEMDTYKIYIVGLILAGSVFASISFSMLGSKDKGIYWLSVPATHLEKLICTIFYTTIVFTAVYSLCFYLVKSLSIILLKNYVANHPGSAYISADVLPPSFKAMMVYLFWTYLAIQSLYLLGSVYFRRHSFIITTVVGAGITFLFVYYLTNLQDAFFHPANWDLTSVRQQDPFQRDQYLVYSISPSVTQIIKYILQFVWAPLFWIVTWFRLKEKQV